jgi:hypothetical protein
MVRAVGQQQPDFGWCEKLRQQPGQAASEILLALVSFEGFSKFRHADCEPNSATLHGPGLCHGD